MLTTTVRSPIVRTVGVGAVGLVAAFVLPFAVHALPWGGATPLGAHLLPIFFVGLVLVLRRQPWPALLVAAAAPWLNQQLTGMPAGPMLPTLTAELLTFTALLLGARRLAPRVAPFVGPIAYLVAAVVARPLLVPSADPLATLTSTIAVAWPGLVLLLAVGVVARERRA